MQRIEYADWKEHSAADREWDKLEKRGVVDKFRRLIPKPKPGEGVTHKHQYPLGEGRKWPHARTQSAAAWSGQSYGAPAALET